MPPYAAGSMKGEAPPHRPGPGGAAAPEVSAVRLETGAQPWASALAFTNGRMLPVRVPVGWDDHVGVAATHRDNWAFSRSLPLACSWRRAPR